MSDINKQDLAETEAESIGEKSNIETEAANTPQSPTETPKLPPHKEYARRMAFFKMMYLQTIVCTATLAILGIALGVRYNVLVGLAIVLCVAFVYNRLTADDLNKRLGMRCKIVVGGLSITRCRAIYGDVLWVPSVLMWNNVEDIGNRAFSCEENATLTRVFLPSSLKTIGADVFAGCDSLRDIYFEGSREAWEKISSKTDMSAYKITFEAKYPPIPKKKKKKQPPKKK